MFKKVKMTLLTLAVLIAVAVVAARFGAFVPLLPHKDPAPLDFKTLALPASPNKYLAAPEVFSVAKADEISPVFNVPATALKEKFTVALAQQPRIERQATSADGLQIDFVQRTPTIHWPDIVTVRFIPLTETTSTVAVYSHSVYGYGDGGVNKARVKFLLSLLN